MAISDNQKIVRFVVCGEYEWYDRNSPNCLLSNYDRSVLTVAMFPPVDLQPQKGDEDTFLKWFERTPDGWRIKSFEDPCYGCGDPWCLLKNYRPHLRQIITMAKGMKRCTN